MGLVVVRTDGIEFRVGINVKGSIVFMGFVVAGG